MAPRFFLTLLLFAFSNFAAALDENQVAEVVLQVEAHLMKGETREALKLLQEARSQHPEALSLMELHALTLLDLGHLAEARQIAATTTSQSDKLQEIVGRIDQQLNRFSNNYNLAHIYIQKRIELQDYQTAILVADLAIQSYPDKHRDLFTLKGEALYKNNDLELAEVELRKALKIDPLNSVAKGYVKEIRSTLEAQTSTEFAEWMRIAKDKVGDFIVTFLALFAAFIANALVAPIALKIRLSRARSAFDRGDYDVFTDVIEGLLDNEDFSPIRANLRYVLRVKGYDAVRNILDKHVVAVDRLPSLQRILERENEKMLSDA